VGLGGVIYSFFLKNHTLYSGNIFGLLLGISYTTVALPLATRSQRIHILLAIFSTYFLTLTLGFISIFFEIEYPIAMASIISLVLFYASPLLNIVHVIK
jgi:hypothetical protein